MFASLHQACRNDTPCELLHGILPLPGKSGGSNMYQYDT
jgi:hypothetical protein